ncbi:hypothetical protein OLZ32_21870, partial [Rhizobium sp. 1AS11]|uniref:hypothetical protein n=1 Tax=Rhizobium acaciae TaxID=2989736 RepID=UPI002221A07F
KALGICGDVSATFSTSQHVLQITAIALTVHTLGDTPEIGRRTWPRSDHRGLSLSRCALK